LSLTRIGAFLIFEALLVYIISLCLHPIRAFIVNKFSSQIIVVNEVAVIIGIAAIIIFTIIAYYLIHQFRNYLKSKKAKETVEANLDILLHDIEDFIKKWRVTRFLRPSYRREIQRKSIGDSRFMVRNHANAIRSSTKGVKVLVNPNENLFTSLDEIVTAMANLGLDIEQVFETVASIKQTSESKFNEMVSVGDNICVKFRNIIPELEELKNRMP
jgi:methyl-accepting chemotaxis protein